MPLSDDLVDPFYKDPVMQGLLGFMLIIGIGIAVMAWLS